MAKNYCKFSKEQDEILIDSVSRHPTLYDVSQKSYKDNTVRENIWRDIGEIIKRSGQDCKTRWRTLRDLYNRKLKLTKNKPTGTPASKKGTTWEYLDHMSFLRKVPNEKVSFTNIDSPMTENNSDNMDDIMDEEGVPLDTDDTVSGNTANNATKRPWEENKIAAKKTNKKSSDRIVDAIVKKAEERTQLFKEILATPAATNKAVTNPIQIFFNSMAQTVMTFPPHLAVEAKAKVCQIVTELEYRSLQQPQSAATATSTSIFGYQQSPLVIIDDMYSLHSSNYSYQSPSPSTNSNVPSPLCPDKGEQPCNINTQSCTSLIMNDTTYLEKL